LNEVIRKKNDFDLLTSGDHTGVKITQYLIDWSLVYVQPVRKIS